MQLPHTSMNVPCLSYLGNFLSILVRTNKTAEFPTCITNNNVATVSLLVISRGQTCVTVQLGASSGSNACLATRDQSRRAICVGWIAAKGGTRTGDVSASALAFSPLSVSIQTNHIWQLEIYRPLIIVTNQHLTLAFWADWTRRAYLRDCFQTEISLPLNTQLSEIFRNGRKAVHERN